MSLEYVKARCNEIGECWELIAKVNTEHGRRYPQLRIKRKTINARRYVYELAKGPVKPDHCVMPKCGNPYCINPDHLKTMSRTEQRRRAGRSLVYSSPARSKKIADYKRATTGKITMEQAREIRNSSESGPVLSARYGINRSRINAIKRGEVWKDYSNPFAGLMA